MQNVWSWWQENNIPWGYILWFLNRVLLLKLGLWFSTRCREPLCISSTSNISCSDDGLLIAIVQASCGHTTSPAPRPASWRTTLHAAEHLPSPPVGGYNVYSGCHCSVSNKGGNDILRQFSQYLAKATSAFTLLKVPNSAFTLNYLLNTAFNNRKNIIIIYIL